MTTTDSTIPYFDDDEDFRAYVESVAAEVGSAAEHCYCSAEKREAYVVVSTRDEKIYPGREVALIWNGDTGWGVAVETHSGEDMLLLGSVSGTPVPTPATVAGLCRRLLGSGT